MKLDLKELNKSAESAYVQQAPKRVHFTVTTIGGASELAKWKEQRKIIEAEQEAKFMAGRERLRASGLNMIAGVKDIPPPTKLELAEIVYERRRQYNTFKNNDSMHTQGPLHDQALLAFDDEPKLTVFSKIKMAWIKIWENAFSS